MDSPLTFGMFSPMWWEHTKCCQKLHWLLNLQMQVPHACGCLHSRTLRLKDTNSYCILSWYDSTLVHAGSSSWCDEKSSRRGFESYCLLTRWPERVYKLVPGGYTRLLRSDMPLKHYSTRDRTTCIYMGHHTCESDRSGHIGLWSEFSND
jgi:hypothetical protein